MSEKRILIEWPSIGAKVQMCKTDKNAKMFDEYCKRLPYHALQIHAMVAGYQWYHYSPCVVDEVTDLIDYNPKLDEIDDGWLLWTPLAGLVGCAYGHNTEYLRTIPIAKVRDEDLETLRAVGRRVWEAVMYTKEVIEVRYSVMEV